MKVGIIGAGFVGSATAFALIMKGIARKVVLLDVNEEKAKAEAEDIGHATAFAYAGKIKAGKYEDLKDAEVVVITAGANQKAGETRLDLLQKNYEVFKKIIPQVVKNAPNAILLIATNPVDIMTYVALKISGLPEHKVMGTGTILDSARFRTLLGYHLGVSPKSIHANVLGEHGDSEVIIWSSAVAGSRQIESLADEMGKPFDNKSKEKMDDNVRNAAYQIIKGKGATYYGIAGAISRICQAIASNEYAIFNLSSFYSDILGVKDICISMPCIIGKRGIHGRIMPKINKAEEEQLMQSAITIKEYCKDF